MANASHLEDAAFAWATSQSIDRAAMEKTKRAMVVRAGFDWEDIGSWPALHRLLARQADTPGNRIWSLTLGRGETYESLAPLACAEYWIVAEGMAAIGEVQLGAKEFARIPAGARGVVVNTGVNDLRLVRSLAGES